MLPTNNLALHRFDRLDHVVLALVQKCTFLAYIDNSLLCRLYHRIIKISIRSELLQLLSKVVQVFPQLGNLCELFALRRYQIKHH